MFIREPLSSVTGYWFHSLHQLKLPPEGSHSHDTNRHHVDIQSRSSLHNTHLAADSICLRCASVNQQPPSVTASTFDGELLHSAPLSSAAVRRQAEAADAAPRPDAGAQDVVGVEVVPALREEDAH